MFKCLGLAIVIVVMGIVLPCYANADLGQLGLADSNDTNFKLALAKVIFFVSILGIGAGLLKKYKGNLKEAPREIVKFGQVQEFKLSSQVRLSLVEIEGRKVVVASNTSGGLALLEISKVSESVDQNEGLLGLVSKNVSNGA